MSAILALWPGNLPVTGEFPAQRPVARSFHMFFYLRLNKRLSKQSWGWWFETPSLSLWRHRSGTDQESSLWIPWHSYYNTFCICIVIKSLLKLSQHDLFRKKLIKGKVICLNHGEGTHANMSCLVHFLFIISNYVSFHFILFYFFFQHFPGYWLNGAHLHFAPVPVDLVLMNLLFSWTWGT